MKRTLQRLSLTVLLLPLGCGPSLLDSLQGTPVCDGQATDPECVWLNPDSTSSGGATPTTTGADDGIGSGPVQTVTGPLDETTFPTTTGTTGPEENLPPTIGLFDVTQDHLSEAGPAELQLVVSADVVKVKLSLDGKELAKNLKPGDFPRNWDALSAKDNGDRIFDVVVEDAEGLTAMATTELSVLLPQPGLEKCLFEDKDANVSIISGLKYTPDAIIAGGTRDTGAGLRLAVWKLDPDHCEVLPGWPKTIANWTDTPALGGMMSGGTAVDVDLDGNIVVAGNFIVGGKPQSYVALLSEGGSQLWAKVGQVGDQVAGVAAAKAQFKNRVFVVGSRQTSDVPVRTDAAIWTYLALDGGVALGSWTPLRAPFSPEEFEPDDENKFSERARAVVIQPGTGNALVVGEREFKPNGNLIFSRAFTVQVHPLGGIVGTPWTSWAPSSVHDAVRSLTVCGDDVLAGGWTRDDPADAKPRPMMFWIEDDGASMKHRDEPQLGSTEINGIACDREAKIISAATRDTGSLDATVFTVPGQDGPRTMYETGTVGDDGAGAVACDGRGFCSWGGYRTINGKMMAVVRVHHP